MKKILLGFVIGLISFGHGFSQTVRWAVRPTSAQLEGYGNLLKVRKNGKCGLIDHNDKEIVPIQYDSITMFRDGYALALNVIGNKLKIEAVISESDNELQTLTEHVYATKYMWFSEGKMPVNNSDGYGYLGTDGNIAIPCQFQMAYPFSEGLASVIIDDKAYYIDRNMEYLPVEAGYGNLVFASTFSAGEAVVYSGNSYTPKGYVINRRGESLRPYKVKPSELKVNKYDHSIGDKAQVFKEQVQQLSADGSYTVFQENGLYGYKKNGRLVLPAQLEMAEPVRGNYANVRYNGQNGVLNIVDGEFSAYIENNKIEVVDGSAGYGFLQLTLPTALIDANIRLKMSDQDGNDMFIQTNVFQGEHRTYSFTPVRVPKISTSDSYTLEVWSDNLLLWEKKYNIDYHVKENLRVEESIASVPAKIVVKPKSPASFTISVPKASKYANPNNEVNVTVTVFNKGEERGIANVTLYVDGQQISTKRVGVRARGYSQAIFVIKNVKKERYAKVKAILNNGKSGQEANIHLMPRI